jgi:hypothetical protein
MEHAAMELNLIIRTIIGCKTKLHKNSFYDGRRIEPLEHLDRARYEGATQAFLVLLSHQSQGRYQPAAKGHPRMDQVNMPGIQRQIGYGRKTPPRPAHGKNRYTTFPPPQDHCEEPHAGSMQKELEKKEGKARQKARKEKKRKRGGMHIGAEELCRGSSVSLRRDIVMQTPRSCSSSAVASKIGKSEPFSFPLKTGWMYY